MPADPPASLPVVQPLRIAITGASGLVGTQLTHSLASGGHTVLPMVRQAARAGSGEITWNPHRGISDVRALEGLDAVVHLAGAPIAGDRWTKRVKQDILTSRSQGTRHLAEALADLDRPPKALLCASAIGYYGDRGDDVLTERSPAGEGYLADVCRAWEDAADAARGAGIRTTHMRTGIVLASEGGALKKMLLPFQMGVGGRIAHGRQYFSWVTIDDTVGAYVHTIRDPSIRGAVNVTSPHPVTNAEFTKALGTVLRRPTVFPIPAFAMRMLYGEMADALLLASARVVPQKLENAGHHFRHTEVLVGLEHVLNKAQ